MADKRLEQAKKALGSETTYKKMTKEEIKMKEREDQLKLEAEKRETMKK
jgi:hypothetical protein